MSSGLDAVLADLARRRDRTGTLPRLPVFVNRAGTVDEEGTHSPTCRCTSAPTFPPPGSLWYERGSGSDGTFVIQPGEGMDPEDFPDAGDLPDGSGLGTVADLPGDLPLPLPEDLPELPASLPPNTGIPAGGSALDVAGPISGPGGFSAGLDGNTTSSRGLVNPAANIGVVYQQREPVILSGVDTLEDLPQYYEYQIEPDNYGGTAYQLHYLPEGTTAKSNIKDIASSVLLQRSQRFDYNRYREDSPEEENEFTNSSTYLNSHRQPFSKMQFVDGAVSFCFDFRDQEVWAVHSRENSDVERVVQEVEQTPFISEPRRQDPLLMQLFALAQAVLRAQREAVDSLLAGAVASLALAFELVKLYGYYIDMMAPISLRINARLEELRNALSAPEEEGPTGPAFIPPPRPEGFRPLSSDREYFATHLLMGAVDGVPVLAAPSLGAWSYNYARSSQLWKYDRYYTAERVYPYMNKVLAPPGGGLSFGAEIGVQGFSGTAFAFVEMDKTYVGYDVSGNHEVLRTPERSIEGFNTYFPTNALPTAPPRPFPFTATDFPTASSRALKHDLAALPDALAGVLTAPAAEWSYCGEDQRRAGPMAEDVPAVLVDRGRMDLGSQLGWLWAALDEAARRLLTPDQIAEVMSR